MMETWDLQIRKISLIYFLVNFPPASPHQPCCNKTHLLLKGWKGHITDRINDCVPKGSWSICLIVWSINIDDLVVITNNK